MSCRFFLVLSNSYTHTHTYEYAHSRIHHIYYTIMDHTHTHISLYLYFVLVDLLFHVAEKFDINLIFYQGTNMLVSKQNRKVIYEALFKGNLD